MSSVKVSALTEITSTTGSEELLINDGGTSKKITIANLTKGHDLPTVPSGIDTDTNKEYNLKLTDVSGTETLTWIEETDNDTTYSTVTTSVDGLAPTLPATHGSKFLRGDATWVVPTDTNTNQLTTFTVSATTDTTPTTISHGDDLLFTAGTGITCETTADGTVTISNTVTDTDTTYSTATTSTEGLVKIEDGTTQTIAANTATATASRTYGVQLNASDQAVVNVPWTDTDTGITDVVDDTTPQLGGNLDVNGNSIVSASNGDIAITPHGTGDVVLDGLKYPQSDGTAGYVLKTDGSAQLSWVAQTTDTKWDGGTTGLTASTGRTSLGLVIGTDVQAYDADTAKTDTTQNYTKPQRSADTVDNDGSFDLNAAQNFTCTPSGNITLTFTNIPDGQSGTIVLINSGGHTITAAASTKVMGDGLLDTVTEAGTYVIGYISDGTNVRVYNSGAQQ